MCMKQNDHMKIFGMALSILLSFIFASCTPLHRKEFTVITPIHVNDIITSNNKDELFNIITHIALKYGMSRQTSESSDSPDVHELYYSIGTDNSRPLSMIILRAIYNDRTKSIRIMIHDMNRISQSKESKEIERELMDAIHKRFGQGAIINK
jgi:hypothetical protein